jgi:hypothetical protein
MVSAGPGISAIPANNTDYQTMGIDNPNFFTPDALLDGIKDGDMPVVQDPENGVNDPLEVRYDAMQTSFLDTELTWFAQTETTADGHKWVFFTKEHGVEADIQAKGMGSHTAQNFRTALQRGDLSIPIRSGTTNMPYEIRCDAAALGEDSAQLEWMARAEQTDNGAKWLLYTQEHGEDADVQYHGVVGNRG